MDFVPIDIERFIDLHVRQHPRENRDELRKRLRDALAAKEAGELCACGNPIWALGSAITGRACFTCITLEAMPDNDYEIVDDRGDREA
jgi:hypothetical protein